MMIDDVKPITINHKDIFDRFFLQDPPLSSELTFTNLFIWRHVHDPVWFHWEDCLFIILRPKGNDPFGLQPIGSGDKKKALATLCEQLKLLTTDPKICRVSEDFVKKYTITPK